MAARSKSVVSDAEQVQLAAELARLGARLQVLETETKPVARAPAAPLQGSARRLAAQGHAAVLDRLVHELDAEHPRLDLHQHPRLPRRAHAGQGHPRGASPPTSSTSSTSRSTISSRCSRSPAPGAWCASSTRSCSTPRRARAAAARYVVHAMDLTQGLRVRAVQRALARRQDQEEQRRRAETAKPARRVADRRSAGGFLLQALMGSKSQRRRASHDDTLPPSSSRRPRRRLRRKTTVSETSGLRRCARRLAGNRHGRDTDVALRGPSASSGAPCVASATATLGGSRLNGVPAAAVVNTLRPEAVK